MGRGNGLAEAVTDNSETSLPLSLILVAQGQETWDYFSSGGGGFTFGAG